MPSASGCESNLHELSLPCSDSSHMCWSMETVRRAVVSFFFPILVGDTGGICAWDIEIDDARCIDDQFIMKCKATVKSPSIAGHSKTERRAEAECVEDDSLCKLACE